jgi:hypothetical protein
MEERVACFLWLAFLKEGISTITAVRFVATLAIFKSH